MERETAAQEDRTLPKVPRHQAAPTWNRDDLGVVWEGRDPRTSVMGSTDAASLANGHYAMRRMRRFLRSQAAAALCAFAVLAPIYIFYSSRLGMNSNSDTAMNVLQAWDMTHGRPLLQGWIQGNNSYLTNELVLYALVAAVLGITPAVAYVSQGILYAVLVVLVGLLAAGKTGDRRHALVAAGLVGAMLLAVTRDTTGWMTLSLIDHLTTAIPLLILLLILDRAKRTWRLGLATFVILTWALTSDHLALYVGVLPVALVTVLRAYFQPSGRLVHLCIAAGALAAVPADFVFKSVLEALGGAARNVPPPLLFASVDEMPANVWETINGLMVIFGAKLFGRGLEGSLTEVAHLGVVATAVAAWMLAIRGHRTMSLVDQILIVAVALNVLAFLFSSMPGPDDNAHEMLVVVPFSAALAGRLIAPRLTTLRARLPVAAGFAAALVLLAHALLLPKIPEPVANLTAWLQQQHLSYGLAGYWQAASVTVQSGGTVAVRPVINDSQGHIGPWDLAVRPDWYDPQHNDARFVISYRGAEMAGTIHDLNDVILVEYFGRPASISRIDEFVVYVYDYNLLDRLLPADELPQQFRYRGPRS